MTRLCLFLLFAFGASIEAQEHSHAGDRHEHQTGSPHAHEAGEPHQHHETAAVVPASNNEAWGIVHASLSEIQSAVDARTLGAVVHAAEERLSAALRYLQTHSPTVTGDKAKRLEAALRQALSIATAVHAASDANDHPRTAAELSKLNAAIKLVAAQYAAAEMQPPAGFVVYVCDMKDFIGEQPGDCPKCGMLLKPRLRSVTESGVVHGPVAPTLEMSAIADSPPAPGKKVKVTLTLKDKAGKPVTPADLVEAHTEKLHLLIIDRSLLDYHHEHPRPTSVPGEFVFEFTPRKPGPYRLWADVLPGATNRQEYVRTDLSVAGSPGAVTAREVTMKTTIEGLEYSLTFDKPPQVGVASTGVLTIKTAEGQVFAALEPIMGTFAHLVGFTEDNESIAHIHPMGPEPTQPTDRGQGELKFHLQPDKPGLLRLFAQVQIGGESKFAPFTLQVQPGPGATP